MKRILFIGLIICFSANTYAEKKMTKAQAIDSLCDSIQDYAKSVMRNRQNDGSAAESIKLINQGARAEPISNYMKAIVYDAYSEPKWESEENKESATAEFANKTYMQCVTTFQKVLSK